MTTLLINHGVQAMRHTNGVNWCSVNQFSSNTVGCEGGAYTSQILLSVIQMKRSRTKTSVYRMFSQYMYSFGLLGDN